MVGKRMGNLELGKLFYKQGTPPFYPVFGVVYVFGKIMHSFQISRKQVFYNIEVVFYNVYYVFEVINTQ
jgi:hypothetical protein